MFTLVSSLLGALASTAASGAVITPTITRSAGTIYNTPALTGYATTGATMVGSVVTVTFADGASSSAIWAATGVGSGSALAASWSLAVNGNTVANSFTLTNRDARAITGLVFDGVPGNTTFDTVQTPEDSPGSSDGQQITAVNGPAGLTVAALYTNELQVGGKFYGDEYTQLVLTLGNGGLVSGQVLAFRSDTDNAVSSALGGGIAVVPEPGSLALLVAGVAGLVGMRRRGRVPA